MSKVIYCKFRNFWENLIFANSVKTHICDVKKFCEQWCDLPISVKREWFRQFVGFLLSRNFAYASFAKIKHSRKFPNLQYIQIKVQIRIFLSQKLYFFCTPKFCMCHIETCHIRKPRH